MQAISTNCLVAIMDIMKIPAGRAEIRLVQQV